VRVEARARAGARILGVLFRLRDTGARLTRARADHHGPPKVNFWQDPKNPGNWKAEQVRARREARGEAKQRHVDAEQISAASCALPPSGSCGCALFARIAAVDQARAAAPGRGRSGRTSRASFRNPNAPCFFRRCS
jgi:hypothetical protein